MKIIILITLIFHISCISLCTWDFGYTQLTIEPSKERIIGRYILSKTSKDYLMNKGLNNEIYELELFENGQYNFINLPSLIFSTTDESNQKVTNMNGKWSVSCESSYACMIELEKVCVQPLVEKNNQIAILITIGDPDLCEGLVYEKIIK